MLLLECRVSIKTFQNYDRSITLDEHVLKMPLDVRVHSLGAENSQITEIINLVGIVVLQYCPYDIYIYKKYIFLSLPPSPTEIAQMR